MLPPQNETVRLKNYIGVLITLMALILALTI
jgi:hypothetical protein